MRNSEINTQAEKYIEQPDACMTYTDGWMEQTDWPYVLNAFKAGAKWSGKDVLEKVCEYLRTKLYVYQQTDVNMYGEFIVTGEYVTCDNDTVEEFIEELCENFKEYYEETKQ